LDWAMAATARRADPASKFGRGLIAIRENEEAAEAIGVPYGVLKLIAFVLSAPFRGGRAA